MSEQQIEQMIQDKGKTAPRVTPSDIEGNILSVHYFTAADGAYQAGRPSDVTETEMDAIAGVLGLLTFCVIILKNGFTVTGESACASPENFDPEIGRTIAYDNARSKIWPLMGYHLKEQLHKKDDYEGL